MFSNAPAKWRKLHQQATYLRIVCLDERRRDIVVAEGKIHTEQERQDGQVRSGIARLCLEQPPLSRTPNSTFITRNDFEDIQLTARL